MASITDLFPTEEEKFYHYLVSANVVYSQDQDGQTLVGTRNVNCMVTSARPVFGVAQIAQAQMGVGQQFDHKMMGAEYQIVDITILNLMLLGHMTKEEFHKVPEDKTPVV